MDGRVKVLITLLVFAVLAFFAGILLWKQQTKGEITMRTLLRRSAPHGPLVSCTYSRSGDSNGNVYTAQLDRTEDGEITLTIRQKTWHNEPLEISVYRADADAIEQLSAIVEKYNMAAWTDLPMSDHVLLDGPSTGIGLDFTDTYVSISYNAALPDKAFDALRELSSCLFQWKQEDRLIEHYIEGADEP